MTSDCRNYIARCAQKNCPSRTWCRLIASIKEHDQEIKSVLQVDEERAQLGLLYGLPAGLKDNLVTKGIRTTSASKFLTNYDPVYDGTVSKKVKDADAIIVGKLNMDEFAMDGSNENSGFFPTKNPWNTDYVPGGSSGGSAAAMAARHFYFTLGCIQIVIPK